MNQQLKVSLKRFAKAFIAGGLGSVGVLLGAGVAIKSLEEAKHLALILLGAFITGGIMGLEKAINFQP